jgi:DNA-binding CsgD family transcriptional regulator
MAKENAFSETVVQRVRQLSVRDYFNARVFGFALARAWVYLLFLGLSTSHITWTSSPVPPLVFIVSSASLCGVLFSSAFLHRQAQSIILHPLLRFAGPLLATVGTILIVFAELPGLSSSPSPAVSPIISEDPWAVLIYASGAVLTGLGSGLLMLGYGELYRSMSPLKIGIEAPFAYLLAGLLFYVLFYFPSPLTSLLCIAMPLISGFLMSKKLDTELTKEGNPTTHKIRLSRFAWRIGLCVCLISLADGVVRAVFMNSSGTDVSDFYKSPLMWASLLTFAIITAGTLFIGERGLRPIYRIVILIMAFFFMLLPIFAGNSAVENTLALTGYGTFNLLIWILLAEMSYRYRLSSVMVFGMGWGMISLGMLFGSFFGEMVSKLAPFSPQAISLIALLATLTILVSYMFVFKEKDLENLIIPDKNSSVEQHQRRFQERCRVIARKYHLSPKESEIMVLFAKGRSSTRIQQDLFISRGTCTTHLRHIYQKLGVHNKQEFLDMIENYEFEA